MLCSRKSLRRKFKPGVLRILESQSTSMRLWRSPSLAWSPPCPTKPSSRRDSGLLEPIPGIPHKFPSQEWLPQVCLHLKNRSGHQTQTQMMVSSWSTMFLSWVRVGTQQQQQQHPLLSESCSHQLQPQLKPQYSLDPSQIRLWSCQSQSPVQL